MDRYVQLPSSEDPFTTDMIDIISVWVHCNETIAKLCRITFLTSLEITCMHAEATVIM